MHDRAFTVIAAFILLTWSVQLPTSVGTDLILAIVFSLLACKLQVVAFVKGTRTQPQCGFSYKVLSILNDSKVPFEVVSHFLAAATTQSLPLPSALPDRLGAPQGA